mmetsp:Transcript_14442/g.25247  ORF Transcript_14442/g.25247 Transcript_14442/m.25247 type:complete len:153 (-) Transcript_14442:172-630(-)
MAATTIQELVGDELLTQHDTQATSEVLEGKKLVMLYFSAHWCPPCRGFTPHLAAKYKATAEELGIEVVFISSDQSESDFRQYFSEMPWTAVPYGARNIKEKLSQLYGVQGIPTLVVLDENGKLLTKNGRGQVDKYFGGGGGGGGGRSRCVIS